MKRPVSSVAQLALAVAAWLTAGSVAVAGNLSSNAGPKQPASNSFNLLYPTSSNAPVIVPSNGTGLPPGKAVVTNPYNVPLFKDAGTLGIAR